MLPYCSIDGVLCHRREPYPSAHAVIKHIRDSRIPFVFLTNSGGTSEEKRAASFTSLFSMSPELSRDDIILSHTPFRQFAEQGKIPPEHDPHVPGGRQIKNAVLVVGGPSSGDARDTAEGYGFKNVIFPADIVAAHVVGEANGSSSIWPLRQVNHRFKKRSKAVPRTPSGKIMPIDAIFVFNDARDWGMDIQMMLDALIPTPRGQEGSVSLSTPDYPPALIFSNPDVVYASGYPIPRIGLGSFCAAFEAIYRRVVEVTRPDLDPQLKFTCIGKPTQTTYRYAEDQLVKKGKTTLKRVYMLGDNPESDIKGANDYRSGRGVEWVSILVETGVYQPGQAFSPGRKPKVVVKDVCEGVRWALDREGWK